MLRKIMSVILVLAFVFSNLFMGVFSADAGTSWTKEKAEHLAKRALYRVTQERIDELYKAGSPEAAYKILTEEPDEKAVQKYENELNYFLNHSDLSRGWTWDKYYWLAITKDPNDFKRKAHFMLEDIFSVSSDTVPAKDIIAWHRHLYDNTFENYEQIVYDSVYSKAPTYYLNLLNSNTHNPNENFARELMQLFLMEQCPPLDPNCSEDEKNYSESDVNSLAYFLTWFRGNRNSENVTYEKKHHNNEAREFLGALYQPYKEDPAQVVHHIFNEREKEIADFVAWRYLKYYVYDEVPQSVIDKYSKIFRANDFEIEPLIKAILTGDEIYSTASMNEIRYKNPIELLLWAQALYRQSTEIIDFPVTQLAELGLSSYRPDGWIFGRAGMDSNDQWIDESTMNIWYSVASRIAYSRNENYDMAHIFNYGDDIDTISDKLEERFFIWAKMPADLRAQFKNVFEDERGLSLDVYNGTIASDRKVRLLIGLTIAQPEFFLQSGYNQNLDAAAVKETASKYDDKGSVILLNFNGWADFLQFWAPTEHEEYRKSRGWLAMNDMDTIHLANGYKMNKELQDFYPYFASGELKIINNAWVPNATRSHSEARIKISKWGMDDFWVSWKFFQDFEGKAQQISFTGTVPTVFSWAKSISVGWRDISFKPPYEVRRAGLHELYPDAIRNIIGARQYPGFVWETVAGGLKLDEMATEAWKAGWSFSGKLNFISKLSQNNIWKVYYVNAYGWYDTHSGQKGRLNWQLRVLNRDLVKFYEQERAAGRKVTIVWFSEFGRTLKMNWNGWTDHWEGSWIFILSNDENIDFPSMAWNVDFSTQDRNWLKHEVDIRAVWNGVFGWVFWEDMTGFFPNNPETNKPYSIYDYPTKEDLHTNNNESLPGKPFPGSWDDSNLDIDLPKEKPKAEAQEHQKPFCNIVASKTVIAPNERVKFDVEMKNHFRVKIPGIWGKDYPDSLKGHWTWRKDYEFGEETKGSFYRTFKESTKQTVLVQSRIDHRTIVDFECSVDIVVQEKYLEPEDERTCDIVMSKTEFKPWEVFEVTLVGQRDIKRAYFNSGESWKGRYLRKMPTRYELVAPNNDMELKMYVVSESRGNQICTKDIKIIKPHEENPDMPYCNLNSRNYVWVRERYKLDWELSPNVVSARLNGTTYYSEYHLKKGWTEFTSPDFKYDILNKDPKINWEMEVYTKDWNKYTCNREIDIRYNRLQQFNRDRVRAEKIEWIIAYEQRLLVNEKNREYYNWGYNYKDYAPKSVVRIKAQIESYQAKGWDTTRNEEALAEIEAKIKEKEEGWDAYLVEWQKKYDAKPAEVWARYE